MINQMLLAFNTYSTPTNCIYLPRLLRRFSSPALSACASDACRTWFLEGAFFAVATILSYQSLRPRRRGRPEKGSKDLTGLGYTAVALFHVLLAVSHASWMHYAASMLAYQIACRVNELS